MSMNFWGRYLKKLSDYNKLDPKYVIVFDEQRSYMEDDYGPPDPPPSRVTVTEAKYISLNSIDEVVEWVKDNMSSKTPKAYKVFTINPVKINTEIKITTE